MTYTIIATDLSELFFSEIYHHCGSGDDYGDYEGDGFGVSIKPQDGYSYGSLDGRGVGGGDPDEDRAETGVVRWRLRPPPQSGDGYGEGLCTQGQKGPMQVQYERLRRLSRGG